MTANELLKELFNRLEAAQEPTVKIGWEEVESWPEGRLEQFIATGLLKPTANAKSIICNGCEEQCLRPVHVYPSSDHRPASIFLACDKREDTSRIPVAPVQLRQWQISRRMLAQTVADLLPLTGTIQPANGNLHWHLGIMRGCKGVQGLILDFSSPLALKVGEHSIPLEEVMFFKDGQIAVNKKMVISVVTKMATTSIANSRYIPSEARRSARKRRTKAHYESWKEEARALRRKHTDKSERWIALQISRMPIANGCSPETIRKNIRV